MRTYQFSVISGKKKNLNNEKTYRWSRLDILNMILTLSVKVSLKIFEGTQKLGAIIGRECTFPPLFQQLITF